MPRSFQFSRFRSLRATGKCWKAAMPATRIGGGSEQIKLAALKVGMKGYERNERIHDRIELI